jgi:hypothetical protein
MRTFQVHGDVVGFDEDRRLEFDRPGKGDAPVGKGHHSDLQLHGVTKATMEPFSDLDSPWLEVNPERRLATFVVARVGPDEQAARVLEIEKKWP